MTCLISIRSKRPQYERGEDRKRRTRTHFHNVVAIRAKTERDGGGKHGELPDRHGGLCLRSVARRPSTVNDRPGTDRVSDIVGAVRKRGDTGSENLDKRIGVFDVVGVLFGIGVHAFHTVTFGRTGDSGLGGVNVVVEPIKEGADNHGGDTLHQETDVADFVDCAGAGWVVVQRAHGPAERTAVGTHLGVKTFFPFSHELRVRELWRSSERPVEVGSFFIFDIPATVVRARRGFGVGLGVLGKIVVLHDRKVGNLDLVLAVHGRRTTPEQRAIDELPSLEGVITLDDAAVDKGDKEERGENGDTATGTEHDRGNVCRRLLVETEVGRALVHDRKRADRTGDEEKEGGGIDGPSGRSTRGAHEDNDLDEHVDASAKASRYRRRHKETTENGSHAFTVVPAPLNLASADSGHADTRHGRDERVGGRDVGRVTGTPHHPRSGTGKGTGKGQHLDSGVPAKGAVGDDAVFDGIGGTGPDSDGAEHFKDGTEHHGLAIRDRAGRDRSGPCVGDIVCIVSVL